VVKHPHNEMNLTFFPKTDVLYCSFGEPRKTLTIEMDNGVVLRLDPATEGVVGFKIVGFLKRSMNAHIFSVPIGRVRSLAGVAAEPETR